MAVARVGHAAPCRTCGREIRTRKRHGAGHAAEGRRTMPTVTMVYWKDEQFWLGKLLQYPEVMTQGETIEELEENLRGACRLMVLADVPDDACIKELEL
jgi:predicted RNase H-like HicB family nuclease